MFTYEGKARTSCTDMNSELCHKMKEAYKAFEIYDGKTKLSDEYIFTLKIARNKANSDFSILAGKGLEDVLKDAESAITALVNGTTISEDLVSACRTLLYQSMTREYEKKAKRIF
jgi:Zn-dependent alcohol dehydrogenase